MTQIDTKTRLLNAAEHLFAQQGFAGTSMRAITTKAAANLAAVNYHFGTKEDLLAAVLARRLRPLNQERETRIAEVLAVARAKPTLPLAMDLMRAFIEPTMAFRSDENNSNDFVVIIGRSLTSADPAVRERFLELVRPILFCLYQALCQALPHIPRELLLTRLFFAMGAVGHCLCFNEVTEFLAVEPSDHPTELNDLTEHLITFVTSGLETPC